MIVIALVWILLSISAAMVAYYRGNSGSSAFFMSLVLSPVIGLTWAIAKPVNVAELEKERFWKKQTKRCDSCAEYVRPDAKTCRYCSGVTFTVSS